MLLYSLKSFQMQARRRLGYLQEGFVLAPRLAYHQPIHKSICLVVCLSAVHGRHIHCVCCANWGGVQYIQRPVELGRVLGFYCR